MFNDFNLKDSEVLEIINKYEDLINKYSLIDGKIEKGLKDEIITIIYLKLTKNRKK